MQLILKNIISFCLLSLVVSHGVIQFGMFEFFRAEIRYEVVQLIGRGVPVHKQVVFSFGKNEIENGTSRLEWKDDDEFRFEGNLFDVIHKEIKGDSVYLYCVYDEDDTILYSVLDSLIEDEKADPEDTNGSGSFLNQYYFCGNFDYDLTNPGSDKDFYFTPGINLLEGEYLINTPPPRLAA